MTLVRFCDEQRHHGVALRLDLENRLTPHRKPDTVLTSFPQLKTTLFARMC